MTVEKAREMLRVSKNSTQEEIAKALQIFQSKYHPDRYSQASDIEKERVKKIFILGGQAKDLLIKELEEEEKRNQEKINLEERMNRVRKRVEESLPKNIEEAVATFKKAAKQFNIRGDNSISSSSTPQEIELFYNNLKKRIDSNASSDPYNKFQNELFLKLFSTAYDIFNKHFQEIAQKKEEQEKAKLESKQKKETIKTLKPRWEIEVFNGSDEDMVIEKEYRNHQSPEIIILPAQKSLYITVDNDNIKAINYWSNTWFKSLNPLSSKREMYGAHDNIRENVLKAYKKHEEQKDSGTLGYAIIIESSKDYRGKIMNSTLDFVHRGSKV